MDWLDNDVESQDDDKFKLKKIKTQEKHYGVAL